MNLSIQENKTPAGVPEKPKEVPKVGELWSLLLSVCCF